MRQNMHQRVGRLLTILISIGVFFACGTESEDFSYTNPEWRVSVSETVTFPLEAPATLSVGLGGNVLDMPNPSRTWLKNRTNVELDYVTIPSSPGEVELGAMMRAGNLPDLIAQKRMGYMVFDAPELFVDFTEFRHLTPNFNSLLNNDEVFRRGTAARFTMDGKLLSLGEYDPADLPYSVSLAYREDLFKKYDLSGDTWEELYKSLKRYKADNPTTFPFAVTGDSLSYNLPSMFGSGLDEHSVVYFDRDAKSWIAGPFEDEFKEFIFYMNKLYEDGILIPDVFGMRDENIGQYLARPESLMAIVKTGTGLRYQNLVAGYGSLDPSGVWNGEGAWYSPLPLPKNSRGETGTLSTDVWNPVSDGWLVNTQSKNVAEAIAFTDFLLSENVALVMEYGPEGIIWNYSGSENVPKMIPEIKTGYNTEGSQTYSEFLKTSNITFGIPLNILKYDPLELLGLKTDPYYRYYVDTEVGTYLRQRAIVMEPGVRVNRSSEFTDSTVGLRVGLQTDISSAIAQFIVGQRPLSEYDEFLQLLEKRGLKNLADTYNENSNIPPDSLISGK